MTCDVGLRVRPRLVFFGFGNKYNKRLPLSSDAFLRIMMTRTANGLARAARTGQCAAAASASRRNFTKCRQFRARAGKSPQRRRTDCNDQLHIAVVVSSRFPSLSLALSPFLFSTLLLHSFPPCFPFSNDHLSLSLSLTRKGWNKKTTAYRRGKYARKIKHFEIRPLQNHTENDILVVLKNFPISLIKPQASSSFCCANVF